MNNAHNTPVRSLLDPHPLVAWPDTTEEFCGITLRFHGVSLQNPWL